MLWNRHRPVGMSSLQGDKITTDQTTPRIKLSVDLDLASLDIDVAPRQPSDFPKPTMAIAFQVPASWATPERRRR